ncbi:unnamed protein product [Darwinula stevensoni]|uniref:EF-hand domain-containing protein n=1 Tax=Darwinula stevensoni TaxID=69355 RepID=A0A7R9A547_9CRUS|nr:unnamed protein product [Darwinula stevensoni]CAG0891333.1 unnamed protein product [Darwinula stevensoni]
MGAGRSKRDLSEEEIEFLLKHTKYNQAAIKEWHKGFIKDCPDGRLARKKFIEVYSMFCPGSNAEAFCSHVFRTFDTNRDGHINFREFLLALDMTSSAVPEEKLKWAFQMYDVDGNGYIEIHEMTAIVDAIYSMLGKGEIQASYGDTPKERAQKIFTKMDVNVDGKVTQDEFIGGCMEDSEIRQLLSHGLSSK